MDPVKHLTDAQHDTLCQLVRLFEAEGIPSALIGAIALLLQNPRSDRETRDIDMAVVAEGGLSGVRAALLADGFRSTTAAHRFRAPNGTELDILGFDPSWDPMYQIPPEQGGTIRAVGVPESITHAARVNLGACEMRVAPLSLLIATKLHTAATVSERRDDLADCVSAMLSYDEAGSRRLLIDHTRYSGHVLSSGVTAPHHPPADQAASCSTSTGSSCDSSWFVVASPPAA